MRKRFPTDLNRHILFYELAVYGRGTKIEMVMVILAILFNGKEREMSLLLKITEAKE